MCILFLWKKFAHTAWCNSLWISCSSPQNRLWRKNPHHCSAFDSYPHNFVLLPLLLPKPMEWYKYLLLFYKETNMVLTSLWIKTEISDKNKQYSTAGWKPCADSKRCSQVGQRTVYSVQLTRDKRLLLNSWLYSTGWFWVSVWHRHGVFTAQSARSIPGGFYHSTDDLPVSPFGLPSFNRG